MSSELPGANGIIARIDRVGQLCAPPRQRKNAGMARAAAATFKNWAARGHGSSPSAWRGCDCHPDFIPSSEREFTRAAE